MVTTEQVQTVDVQLCICGCGGTPRSAKARYLPGHNYPGRSPHSRQRVNRTRTCLHCDTPFPVQPTESDSRKYCSRECSAKGIKRWKPDTNLKLRVAQKLAERRLSVSAASKEIGINHGTMKSWLRKPKARITMPVLAPVAQWLGISADDAQLLQDGSVEEHSRVFLRELEGAQKARNDPKHLRRMTTAAAKATRGKPFTDEHRSRIAEALKEHCQTQGPGHRGKFRQTLRGRAIALRVAVTRSHPNHSIAQVITSAATRLLADPYNVIDEQAARMLLATKAELQEIERQARLTGHRPPGEKRHQRIEEIRAQWPRTPAGNVTRGLWPACVTACEAAGDRLKGESARDKATRLMQWYGEHCRETCTIVDGSLYTEKPNEDQSSATAFPTLLPGDERGR